MSEAASFLPAVGGVIGFAVGSLAGGIGGPIGGAIGSALGSLGVAYLRKPTVSEGQRLGSLPLSTAQPGAPIVRAYGPQVRLPGVILWVSPTREVVSDTPIGGKGDPAPAAIQQSYSYFVDIAVAVCAGPVAAITRVQADGLQMFDAGGIVYEVDGSTDLLAHVYSGTVLHIESPIGGPHFVELGFRVGYDAVVSGFANGGNNGTFRVLEVGAHSSGVSWIDLQAVAPVDEAAGASVSVVQTLPADIFAHCTAITRYVGSASQTADPTIAAHEANVPAFRGIAYVVIEGVSLGAFGNRIPNINVWVEADTAPFTVGEAIARTLTNAGLTADQFDASAYDAVELQGYHHGPVSALDALGPLVDTFDAALIDTGSQLIFKPRTGTDVADIDVDALGAADGTFSRAEAITFADTNPAALPDAVELEFVSTATDWGLQPDVTTARVAERQAIDRQHVSRSYSIALDPGDAREVAERLLWLPRTRRRSAQLSLPPRYWWLKAEDRLLVVQGDEQHVIRCETVTIGANLRVEVLGAVEVAATMPSGLGSDSLPGGVGGSSGVYVPPVVVLYLLDLPPLASAHATQTGLYYAVATRDTTKPWPGGSLFESADAGASWRLASNFPPASIMGDCLTTLGNAPSTTCWDGSSSVQVRLFSGSLASVTEAQALTGVANVALIGDEVVTFRSATLIGVQTYQLYNFIRGRRNTEAHATGHGSGERFVLLSSRLEFVELSIAGIGVEREYRAVAAGDDVTAVDSTAFTPAGATLRPFAPTAISGARDGSGDIVISWTRRSRDVVRFLGGPEVDDPDGPDSALRWAIELLADGGGSVVRTVEQTGSTSYTYTAAQQTADSLTPGDPRPVRIYQVSPTVGRGNAGSATV